MKRWKKTVFDGVVVVDSYSFEYWKRMMTSKKIQRQELKEKDWQGKADRKK